MNDLYGFIKIGIYSVSSGTSQAGGYNYTNILNPCEKDKYLILGTLRSAILLQGKMRHSPTAKG